MPNSLDSVGAPCGASFLWVNLTREVRTALGESVGGAFAVSRIQKPTQIPLAIERHAPQFLCFEFDEPDASGMTALAHTRRTYPGLPVVMITGCHSEAVALWALRIRVWDLLIKPLSNEELSQCIGTLINLTRLSGTGAAHRREILFPSQGTEALFALHGPGRPGRTSPAIVHVATHFEHKITLHHAAALCRLSPSQFCRVFRQEQGVSFGQYLLRYRLERACEGLADPRVLAKEVAYAVGFNDLSYFSRAFRRQVGVCPSEYQAGARLS